MLLKVDVERDEFGTWLAWFADDHPDKFSGKQPGNAIWSLFSASTSHWVNAASIIALEPESGTKLRFTVETEVPSSAPRVSGTWS